MMKTKYLSNIQLVLIIVFSFIFFFKCERRNNVEEIHHCFRLFPNDSIRAPYYLESKIKVYKEGDSTYIHEKILKVPHINTESSKIFSNSVYLLNKGNLFKKYLEEDRVSYHKYLTINDTNTVEYIDFANRIPNSNIHYHLVEKNETRKFLGVEKKPSDTLYKFEVEDNQIDGVKRLEFYSTQFFLVKTIFLSSSVDIDSIVIDYSCK